MFIENLSLTLNPQIEESQLIFTRDKLPPTLVVAAGLQRNNIIRLKTTITDEKERNKIAIDGNEDDGQIIVPREQLHLLEKTITNRCQT